MKARRSKKQRTKLEHMMGNLYDTLGEPSFLDRARKRPQDFTRKRKMPFQDLMVMLLNQYTCATQCAIHRFFREKGEPDKFMKQQSLSEARMKVRWQAFRELFEGSVRAIYGEDSGWDTWHGYTVFAVDGSKTQLPDDPELLAEFGGTGPNADAPTAQASYLYDVLNDVIADALFAPVSTPERKLAKLHLKRLRQLRAIEKKLLIFDRGYPSADMIAALREAGCDFVFRVRRKFNVELDALPLGVHSFRLVGESDVSYDLRAVKFQLDNGETETLLTSLEDRRMGVKSFKDLYFARWGVETKIGELKRKIEIENFSGRKKLTLLQDFYACVLLSNSVSVAIRQAQPLIDFATDPSNKYAYKADRNNAIGAFKDDFVAALLESSNRKRKRAIERIVFRCALGKVPIRPNRSLPRNPCPRQANFRHNQKSNA
jgi:hypothetical protein